MFIKTPRGNRINVNTIEEIWRNEKGNVLIRFTSGKEQIYPNMYWGEFWRQVEELTGARNA